MVGQERGLPGEALGERDVVGVDARDQRRARGPETAIQRRRLPAARLSKHGQPRVADRREPLRRPVGRAVVHHDELEVDQRLSQDAGQGLAQPRLAVVDGHHDGDGRRTHRFTATSRIM